MNQYLSIAGLNFAISTDENLVIGEQARSFRGFATENPATDAYRIHFADRPDLKLDIENDEKLSALTAQTDDCTRLLRMQGRTTVVEAILNNNPYFSKIRMSIDADGTTLFECQRHNLNIYNIDTYIHPLFTIALRSHLVNHRGALVHSSVVNDGNFGLLFTALSGTGKSTMAQIWRSCGARIINDDMHALRIDGESVVAHNIPMQTYKQTPRSTPIQVICLISQSRENFIRPCTGALAAARVMSNSLCLNYDAQLSALHSQNIIDICSRVHVLEVGFKPDTDIVFMLRRYLEQTL